MIDFTTMLIGAEGARLLRKKRVQGRPRRSLRRGGSRTARGKRTPGAEINRLVDRAKLKGPGGCCSVFLIIKKEVYFCRNRSKVSKNKTGGEMWRNVVHY